MKVNCVDIVPGCVLSSDVFAESQTPIMLKKTALSKEHIEVLKAFLINVVEVDPVLVNGKPFSPKGAVVNDRGHVGQELYVDSLTKAYLQGVERYETLFQTFQQGKNSDIFSVISFFNPLIDHFLTKPMDLLTLYHHSTEKGYIFHHSVSVGLLGAYFAMKLKYSKKEVSEIGIAGLLADCGMAKLPPRLYEKPNQLSKSEFSLLERHPIYSYQMLKDLSAIGEGVPLAALQHHERLDGSGYPLKFTSQKLHPYGKLIAVIDVFHAMVSIRPYRPKQSPFKVLEMMNRDQFGKFDHKILSLLTDEVVKLSIGTKVRLSNLEIGEIIFTEREEPTRPIIRLDDGSTISLKSHRDLFIDEIIS